jgi:hypothetical protein
MTEDIEAGIAAEAIQSLLWLVRLETGIAALAKATEALEAKRKEVEKHGLLIPIDISDESWMQSFGHRHWNAIMRFKAAVAYTFIRKITNNHHPKDAMRLLFGGYDYDVPGSGNLLDYIGDLCEDAKRQQRTDA